MLNEALAMEAFIGDITVRVTVPPFVELIAPGLKNSFPSAFTSMYAGLTIVESVHVINKGTVAETVEEIS